MDRTAQSQIDHGRIASFGITRSESGFAYTSNFPALRRLIFQHTLADALRIEDRTDIVNCADIFMDYETGLRHRNSLEQLVDLSGAGTRTSESMKTAPAAETGEMEYDLAANYNSNGLPYSCHPMVSAGRKLQWD